MRAGQGSWSDTRTLCAVQRLMASGRDVAVTTGSQPRSSRHPPPPSSRREAGRAEGAWLLQSTVPPGSSAGSCPHADTARCVEGGVRPSGSKSLQKPEDGACRTPCLVSDLKKKTKV